MNYIFLNEERLNAAATSHISMSCLFCLTLFFLFSSSNFVLFFVQFVASHVKVGISMKFINKDLYISISKCVLWWSLEIWNTTVNLKVNRLILTAEWKCVDQFEASNPPICTQTRATFSGVSTFEDWFLQIPAQHWVFRCPTQVPELIRDVL